ncbi:hypothetical protein BAE44_0006879, partial [Dichanthelium oligosanthes]
GRLPPPLPGRPPLAAVLHAGPRLHARQRLLLLLGLPALQQRLLLPRLRQERRFPWRRRRRRPADRDLHHGASAAPAPAAGTHAGAAPAAGVEGGAHGGRRPRRRGQERRRWRGQHVVPQRPGDEAASKGGQLQGLLGGGQGEGVAAPGAPVVQGQVLRDLPPRM